MAQGGTCNGQDVVHVGHRIAAQDGARLGREDQGLTAAGASAVAHVLSYISAGAGTPGPGSPGQSHRELNRLVRRRDLWDEVPESNHLGWCDDRL